MKRYMGIREYCEESGFPEKLMRRLTRTHMAHRFCKRTGEYENSHILITVEKFEDMWEKGEFRSCL